MNATQWRRTKDLFARALEQPQEGREDFLREACGNDLALQEEVASLLEAHDETGQLIERSDYGVASIFNAAGEAYEGKEFGHYKIIREIGRGGMGAVFLAERSDGEFKQQVALKVVRRTFADSELARRFRRERQILASLNHTNIARLLDGGVSSDGEPFLAMEYVEGVRVDDYCNEHQLSTNRRLQLFLAICAGVSYAHQNLIVHRDIKPSNVLVTADGTPKLLDFGIAKLLDAKHADEHTETSFRAFTPDYAAPEQISGGQITTASDVYSLGVLLQDLLSAARHPSNVQLAIGKWNSESEQKTVPTNLPTNQENENKSAKAYTPKFVSDELKNIIAMARRAEPTRRYATVAEFADDIQRYLDGLPVRAQKDSFTYRTGKFVRRNKIGVGAAALIALSLIIGIGIALWQTRVARVERNRAERRFNDVRHLSNALLTDIAPKIERLQGSTEARQALVVQSLKYLDSLAQEVGDDKGLQSELAAAYEKIGDLQGNPDKPNLSDFAGAISSYEKANTIRRNLPDNPENQTLLAENLRGLGNVRYAQNDVKGTLRDFADALKIYEKLLTADSKPFALQTAYLEAQIKLAEIYIYMNQYAVAVPILRKALAALEHLDQSQEETQRLLTKGYSQLGNALSWDGKQPEAEREMLKAVAIAESCVVKYPNDTALLQNVWRTFMLASSIYENNKNEIALQFAQKALKTAEKAVVTDAADTQAKHNLAKSFSRIGIAYALLNKLPEAVTNLAQSEKLYLELVEREPKNRGYQHDLGTLYTRFGDTKQKQGDLQGALKAFQKSTGLYEMAFQADEKNTVDRRNLAQSLKSIGYVYLELADRKMAKENFQRALEILNQLKSQNALGNFDNKLFDEVQSNLQKL